MSLFAESIKKIHIENLMSYLFYGTESLEHILQEEEKRLDCPILKFTAPWINFTEKIQKRKKFLEHGQKRLSKTLPLSMMIFTLRSDSLQERKCPVVCWRNISREKR